jgi:ketosteroid isomerase-like protein
MAAADMEELAKRLFGAYGEGDLETMRSLLAEDMIGWVTNAAGGVDRTEGRDAYMARLPDLSEARLETRVTQVLGIDEERVMTMIAIRAERMGKSLENFAAFLARVEDGEVAELWMVEAQPAYSDEFWS